VFDTPDLAAMDDAIADGTFELPPGAPEPLSLFRAARVDYSLRRLYHYTGTDPEHFQNFVIFTNYQLYVDAFVQLCQQRLASGEIGPMPSLRPGIRSRAMRGLAAARPGLRLSARHRCLPFISSSPAIAALP
jgi:AMP nucleosidase